MQQLCFALVAAAGGVVCISAAPAADCPCREPTCSTCTDAAACRSCEPACKSSWDKNKTKKPKYSMACEFSGARATECFCTGPAECRCNPPRGTVVITKKLYKTAGEEEVEKVPKYEVQMVPADPCDCAHCSGVCWWNPLSILHYLVHR
jgi:hypothetical protein